jgi:pyrroloquinoline-quinone synthase
MPKPPEELIQELMKGRQAYRMERPTRLLIQHGKLTKDQVKMWVKQLYYYRVNVPRKELYILANCSVKEVRMERMRKYIEEEDSRVMGGSVGAHAELWAKLAEGLGIPHDELEDFRDLCEPYKVVCDSWVNYARDHSWLEGASTSFDEDSGTGKSGHGMKMAEAMAKFYGVPDWGLVHFTLHSEMDIEHGSSTRDLIQKYAITDEQQVGVRRAVQFKRAFHLLEDQCMRIACGIDPKLYVELE